MKYKPWMTEEEAVVYRRLLKAKKTRTKFFKGVFDFFTWGFFLFASSITVYSFFFLEVKFIEEVFFFDAFLINTNLIIIHHLYSSFPKWEIIPEPMYAYSLSNLGSPFEIILNEIKKYRK